jgi:selenide,water dikinase
MVDLGTHGDVERDLLCDPQTSGGLLVTCAQDAVDAVLAVFRERGFEHAAAIGEIAQGEPGIRVL